MDVEPYPHLCHLLSHLPPESHSSFSLKTNPLTFHTKLYSHDSHHFLSVFKIKNILPLSIFPPGNNLNPLKKKKCTKTILHLILTSSNLSFYFPMLEHCLLDFFIYLFIFRYFPCKRKAGWGIMEGQYCDKDPYDGDEGE